MLISDRITNIPVNIRPYPKTATFNAFCNVTRSHGIRLLLKTLYLNKFRRNIPSNTINVQYHSILQHQTNYSTPFDVTEMIEIATIICTYPNPPEIEIMCIVVKINGTCGLRIDLGTPVSLATTYNNN